MVGRAAGDYRASEAAFGAVGGDVLGAFLGLAERGPLSLWTSTATHCVLPLLATEAGVHLLVGNGTAAHERRFGGWSGGFWLPECAYAPGMERELAERG